MSVLWKHFQNVASDNVKCNHCEARFSYKKGNRSIMRKHLERKHPQTLGITTVALTDESFQANFENSNIDIHTMFHNDDNIKYFIQMVFERPTLYEYSKSIGWNSKHNKAIWQEIANVFQVDINECQKFWKYLKETYILHSRNPKLDDHKYGKQLAFLGDMYMKRRLRKEQRAKQRKPINTYDASTSSISNSSNNTIFCLGSADVEENLETAKHSEKSTQKRKHSTDDIPFLEAYEIAYEPYESDDLCENQIEPATTGAENISEQYGSKNLTDFIMKDIYNEQHASSLNQYFNDQPSIIIDLANKSTQTDGLNEGEQMGVSTNGAKKCSTCLNKFDDLDFLMEFIKVKIRKLSPKHRNKLQINILKTVMEAEKDDISKIV